MTTRQQLVLGSTSPFRRELLGRLQIPFETAAPDIDETPEPDETPQGMVMRLARLKAEAVAKDHPHALVIGSDQCAVIDGRILGKPGSHEMAVQQLAAASGKSVVFHTGLCLLNAATGRAQVRDVPFSVHFRQLGAAQIESYLQRERPYNCAGSFKSEGLGISLFRAMEGDDPTALIGLPLIALTDMLAEEGLEVLA